MSHFLRGQFHFMSVSWSQTALIFQGMFLRSPDGTGGEMHL